MEIKHIFHALAIAVISYIIMTLGFKQPVSVAATSSIVIWIIAVVYMLLFGHGLPKL
jgi:hypothetical protein